MSAPSPEQAPPGDWQAQLFARRHLGVRLDLGPTRRLLGATCPELLERPPFEVVQIVGTNGKGSTAAMVEHGLRTSAAARGPIGLFTSPHLERIGERVRIDGVPARDEDIRRGVEDIAAIERELGLRLSFFEVLTALALRCFVARGCSHVVLEAGLGARLDATTAVPADRVGIARVALDHQAYLGDSLTAIAHEKAAAIRSPAPAFSVAQAPEVADILRARAHEQGARLRFVEPCARAPHALRGPHQRHNAALALALLEDMGATTPGLPGIEQLDGVSWPGRLERLALPAAGAGELWLDVAHNLDGVQTLIAALAQLELRPTRIVFGAMADKAGEAMAAALAPLAPLWLVPPAERGSYALAQLAEAAGGVELDARFEGPRDPRLQAQLAAALERGERVLVCGSHFLVGQLRARLLARACDDPRLSDPLRRA